MIKLFEKEVSNVNVVQVEGRVIYETEKEFKETITNLIEAGKVNIVLNLSGLSYINSSGLGVLINLLKQAQGNGGDVKLVNLQPEISELFKITSLIQVFKIFESEDEAVSSFA